MVKIIKSKYNINFPWYFITVKIPSSSHQTLCWLIFLDVGADKFIFGYLYYQVQQLDAKAQELIAKHPDQEDAIKAKLADITENWTGVTDKANTRKAKLLDSYDYQKFLAEYRYGVNTNTVTG